MPGYDTIFFINRVYFFIAGLFCRRLYRRSIIKRKIKSKADRMRRRFILARRLDYGNPSCFNARRLAA